MAINRKLNDLDTTYPLEEVLCTLGFARNNLGIFENSFKAMDVAITPNFPGWGIQISSRSHSSGEIIAPYHTYLKNKYSLGEFLIFLYERWYEFFPKRPVPALLQIGESLLEHEKLMNRVSHKKVAAWANREILRFNINTIINYNAEELDYLIKFSIDSDQLKIDTPAITLFCPVNPVIFVGYMEVTAKEFIQRLPSRFLGSETSVCFMADKIIIQDREIPAKWRE